MSELATTYRTLARGTHSGLQQKLRLSLLEPGSSLASPIGGPCGTIAAIEPEHGIFPAVELVRLAAAGIALLTVGLFAASAMSQGSSTTPTGREFSGRGRATYARWTKTTDRGAAQFGMGSSVRFSGDDRIVLGDIPNLAGDLTFELWLRPGDRSVRRSPLAKAYSGEGNITQETNGALTFHHGDGGGNAPGYDLLRSSPLVGDAWSHVVVTRSGLTVSWYIDGALDVQKVFSRSPTDSTLPLIIGDGNRAGYDGYIDEVAIYDRALALEEILEHYENIGNDTIYGNLVADDEPVGYWRLDDGPGATVVDRIAGNDGTISGTPEHTQPGASVPQFDSALISIDGAYFGQYFETDRFLINPDPALTVAKSRIDLSVVLSDSVGPVVCQLGGLPMNRIADDLYRIEFQPAYFYEVLPLTCSLGTTPLIEFNVELVGRDDLLDSYNASRLLPRGTTDGTSDPYGGWRQRNYYASIYRFIEYGEIYRNPELYGIIEDSEYYRDVEAFLINGAEAFFEPCVDYDIFSAIVSRQCRSTERIGAYYLWRSPNDSAIRTIHFKAEIRGAAGVAQATKAILLRHADEVSGTENCEISDNPSEISTSSLICRALNVRRLLFREVWAKWTDDSWLYTAAVSPLDSIRGTPVPHYVAWSELIADLFLQTRDIPHSTSAGMEEPYAPESRRDFLLGFFGTTADGYLTMRCSNPEIPRACPWSGYDVSQADGVEIGHQDLSIHLLTQYGDLVACPSGGSGCVDFAQLARTLNERTWSDRSVAELPGAVNFLKFDIFLDGHCGANALNEQDPLYGICRTTWFEETDTWRPNRALFGWVNLGTLDRDLMIRLRQSVDENHDGLLDVADARLRNFATHLLKAMSKYGRFDE